MMRWLFGDEEAIWVNSSSAEERMPNLGEFHRCRAFSIIVSDVIDLIAYGIAPHQPRIEGLSKANSSATVRVREL